MNFLSLRRVAPWVVALAAVGCGSGASDRDPTVDASASGADAGAVAADAPSPAADLAPPTACSTSGSSRLRVSLGLDPGLALRGPEVWLLVRCGNGDASSERVLRWDRASTQTIDGLGPGSYQVVGSSFLAPWSSTRVTLSDNATAAVSLTLPPDPPVLAQLHSDASGTGGGAVWRASVPLTSAGLAASVASLEVEARPYVSDPPAATDHDFVSVTAVVRNPCSGNLCSSYTLRALEIRSTAGDDPSGLGGFVFPVDERLAAGESKSIPQSMVLRGALPDLTHGLELVLYGALATPAGAH